jgi:FkbM family methyltransferase
MNNIFSDEYDLTKLISVPVRNFKMLVTPRFVERYRDYEYESLSSEILLNYLPPKGTFLDIGAHYGYYTLLAKTSFPQSRCISIEPVSENFKVLKKNLRINGLSDVETHNAAASDSKGVSSFNITEASDSGGFYEHPLTKVMKQIDMQTISVDSVIGDRHVDFIKIDVEGHEIAVLNGMKKTIKQNDRLVLLVEFNPKVLIKAGVEPEALLDTIDLLGFETYLVDDQKRKYIRLTDNVLGWRELMDPQAAVNIFCVKKENSLMVLYFAHSGGHAGSERSLLEITTQLTSYQAINHVIVPEDATFVKFLKGSAVASSVIPYSKWAEGKPPSHGNDFIDSIPETINTCLQEIRKINPHVIYTNTSVIPWGAICAKVQNLPHAWHVREFGTSDYNLHYYLGWNEVASLIGQMSDVVFFNSKAVQSQYGSHIPINKCNVVYQNVQVSNELSQQVPEYSFSRKKSLKLIIMGAVIPAKGQDQAIRAVTSLLDEGLDIELIIMGALHMDPVYEDELRQLSGKYFEDRIKFTPFLPNPFPTLVQSDVLLMCSFKEAFGRVTVEAMKFKKLVIGTDSGGTSELINHQNTGLLYPHNNIAELKNRIHWVYDNRKEARDLAYRGQKWANKNINMENFAGTIYDDLIKLKRKGPVPSETQTYIDKFTHIVFGNMRASQNAQETNEVNVPISEEENCESLLVKNIINHETIDEVETDDRDYARYSHYLETIVGITGINETEVLSQLERDINQISNQITDTKTHIQGLEHSIKLLTSAKFFKLWQLYCSLRKLLINR